MFIRLGSFCAKYNGAIVLLNDAIVLINAVMFMNGVEYLPMMCMNDAVVLMNDTIILMKDAVVFMNDATVLRNTVLMDHIIALVICEWFSSSYKWCCAYEWYSVLM